MWKKVVTGLVGATLALNIPVAHADGATYVSKQQCETMHKEAAAGKPLSYPKLLRYRNGQSGLDGDTLHLYADPSLKDAVHDAADLWVKASDGKIKFQFHDQPGAGIVTVTDKSQDGVYGTGAMGETIYRDNGEVKIVLNPLIKRSEQKSKLYIIAHEMGHAMGLVHGCVGDIMRAGGGPGPLTPEPTKTDAAAVTQGVKGFEK